MERVQNKIDSLCKQVIEYFRYVKQHGEPPFSQKEVLHEYIKICEKYHKCMSDMYSLDLLSWDEYYEYTIQLEYIMDRCHEEINKLK